MSNHSIDFHPNLESQAWTRRITCSQFEQGELARPSLLPDGSQASRLYWDIRAEAEQRYGDVDCHNPLRMASVEGARLEYFRAFHIHQQLRVRQGFTPAESADAELEQLRSQIGHDFKKPLDRLRLRRFARQLHGAYLELYREAAEYDYVVDASSLGCTMSEMSQQPSSEHPSMMRASVEQLEAHFAMKDAIKPAKLTDLDATDKPNLIFGRLHSDLAFEMQNGDESKIGTLREQISLAEQFNAFCQLGKHEFGMTPNDAVTFAEEQTTALLGRHEYLADQATLEALLGEMAEAFRGHTWRPLKQPKSDT